MTEQLVVVQLAAILAASTYDKDQAVIKWGGLLVAVATVIIALVGN